jgi:hypothetical protein
MSAVGRVDHRDSDVLAVAGHAGSSDPWIRTVLMCSTSSSSGYSRPTGPSRGRDERGPGVRAAESPTSKRLSVGAVVVAVGMPALSTAFFELVRLEGDSSPAAKAATMITQLSLAGFLSAASTRRWAFGPDRPRTADLGLVRRQLDGSE